ncbi:LutB/LldF family L-lactate oxidation iron-sulfur protein [Aneurinibacillus tyrosinisolvens]|uniref:LutB/LldF family L-lactate oxidation iron-sulfur protein n=1 Tax=Aneurinibacillus tyrosinisolvens TaxID=1443435 RepID=UPI00063F7DB9|nr:LutB/LldF family L-lactate oxidation iron-sulfur protein [Aneurinibacillus tyrosinisolvens]
MSTFNPTTTLKERAEISLNDAFLRNAVKYTTEKLRTAKKLASEEQGNWEEWRERARQIRLHTIANLDYYLAQFIENARAAGVHIHFASTAEEAVEITMKIAEAKGAKSVVKSKSMVSEEIHINHTLEGKGIETVESDLGEYIIQLAGETPSHIIIPAIHKNKQQVADLFSAEAGETLPPETQVLAGFARAKLREKFLEADIGMTGCNFAIAETGSMVLFSNEGNARMVSTVPKTQITYMGMERIIPSLDDLEVMATMLPRSATGQKLTVYMSTITGPQRTEDSDGPEEMHIIILDNGRSSQLGDPEFQEVLNCIRCGACLNACPVYRHVGGHTYGWVYSGPIGAVLTPRLNQDVEKWGDVAYASSLCGACHEACPVKIPLHDMLVYIRRQKVEEGYTPKSERMAFKGFKYLMSDYRRFKRSMNLGKLGQKVIVQDGVIKSKLGPLKGWNSYRHAPKLADQSFRDSWKALDHDLSREVAEMDPEVMKRMKEIMKNRGEEKR